MNTSSIDYNSARLDTSEIQARLEELESRLSDILQSGDISALSEFAGIDEGDLTLEEFDLDDWCGGSDPEASDGHELAALRQLALDAGACSGWGLGALVEDSGEFEEYARETAQGMHGNVDDWPFNCIDWERAADQLREDYKSTEFNGRTYLIRH